MRILVPSLLSAALLLAAPAGAAPAVTSATPAPSSRTADATALEERLAARLDELTKAGLEDCPAGRPDLIAYAHSQYFPLVDEAVRRRTLLIIVACTEGFDSEGVDASRRLEAIAEAPVERGVANYQLMLHERKRAPLSAARRLAVVLADLPELVIAWEPAWFRSMLHAAREDRALELTLLSRMAALDWTHPDAREAVRIWWRVDLARRQADLNDLPALRDTVRSIDDPATLVSIAQDRRFAALWTEMQAAGRFDWLAVGEADVARQRNRVAENRRDLESVRGLMRILRELGRYDEAVTVGLAARQQLIDPKAFDDQANNAHWLLNDLAYAYGDAGRLAEADEAFREAVATAAPQGDRISQPVNYSEMLVRHGREREALVLLQAITDKDGSAIGLNWRDAGLACAQAGSDRTRADALADDLLKRWEANPAAVSHALLCLDRLDDAAALMVRRLRSDDHRAEALTASVIGKRPPGGDTAWDRRMQANRDAVWARPEVKAALAPVGRRIEVPYFGSYWGAE